MADITKYCRVYGRQQGAERPFSWHVYEVNIPASAVSVGPDDCFIDWFPSGTKFLLAQCGVTVAATNAGGSTTYDFEHCGYDPGSKTLINNGNIINAVDAESLDVEVVSSSGLEVLNAYTPTYQSGSETPGTYKPALNLELTNTTAAMTTDLQIYLGVLCGRVTGN